MVIVRSWCAKAQEFAISATGGWTLTLQNTNGSIGSLDLETFLRAQGTDWDWITVPFLNDSSELIEQTADCWSCKLHDAKSLRLP